MANICSATWPVFAPPLTRSLPNERVPAFYNGRGTAEQHIKEGKYALKWTRLSCMRFAANAVRLGVVARIGCQVLTQAFATTTDMLNAA